MKLTESLRLLVPAHSWSICRNPFNPSTFQKPRCLARAPVFRTLMHQLFIRISADCHIPVVFLRWIPSRQPMMIFEASWSHGISPLLVWPRGSFWPWSRISSPSGMCRISILFENRHSTFNFQECLSKVSLLKADMPDCETWRGNVWRSMRLKPPSWMTSSFNKLPQNWT